MNLLDQMVDVFGKRWLRDSYSVGEIGGFAERIVELEKALEKISDRCCEPCCMYADEALQSRKNLQSLD